MDKKKQNHIESIPKNASLIDVRSSLEFKLGSIPNALNIPLGRIAFNLNELSALQNIVVFCRSGIRSKKAKHILEKNGFKKVIDGGSIHNVKDLLSKQSTQH